MQNQKNKLYELNEIKSFKLALLSMMLQKEIEKIDKDIYSFSGYFKYFFQDRFILKMKRFYELFPKPADDIDYCEIIALKSTASLQKEDDKYYITNVLNRLSHISGQRITSDDYIKELKDLMGIEFGIWMQSYPYFSKKSKFSSFFDLPVGEISEYSNTVFFNRKFNWTIDVNKFIQKEFISKTPSEKIELFLMKLFKENKTSNMSIFYRVIESNDDLSLSLCKSEKLDNVYRRKIVEKVPYSVLYQLVVTNVCEPLPKGSGYKLYSDNS